MIILKKPESSFDVIWSIHASTFRSAPERKLPTFALLLLAQLIVNRARARPVER